MLEMEASEEIEYEEPKYLKDIYFMVSDQILTHYCNYLFSAAYKLSPFARHAGFRPRT